MAELLPVVPGAKYAGPPAASVAVTGVTHDSRAVRRGDLYAALPGRRTHGVEFAAAAAAGGAVAVLTDPVGRDGAVASGLPVLVVPDPRAVLGPVAARVYGDPSADLLVIGVTGTNGKTTTAYLLEAGLRAAGHRTGLVGTVETRVAETVVPNPRTTPEAPDLQALFAVMRERGVDAVAMEVSSHALALGRVAGTAFDVAVFTNLSQDHLDFHHDMAAYYAAKTRLFHPALSRTGVVNVDDAYGAALARTAPIPVTGVSPRGHAAAQWRVDGPVPSPDGSTFALLGPGGARIAAATLLPGAFNVENAALAIVALVVAGVPAELAAAGVGSCPGVPGRMEQIVAGQPFLAVVDYAHTPEAVTTLLATLRPLTRGRILAVLGCGGDRDRAKRPLMGAALAAGADIAVLTSDNPRSEDPQEILAEMAAGAPAAVVIEDRAAAIGYVVEQARPGDTVVIAGKGHEQGQEYAEHTVPFDDREVLRAALARLGSAA